MRQPPHISHPMAYHNALGCFKDYMVGQGHHLTNQHLEMMDLDLVLRDITSGLAYEQPHKPNPSLQAAAHKFVEGIIAESAKTLVQRFRYKTLREFYEGISSPTRKETQLPEHRLTTEDRSFLEQKLTAAARHYIKEQSQAGKETQR